MPVVEDDDDGRLEDEDSSQIRRMIESDLSELGVTLEGLDPEAESPPHAAPDRG